MIEYAIDLQTQTLIEYVQLIDDNNNSQPLTINVTEIDSLWAPEE